MGLKVENPFQFCWKSSTDKIEKVEFPKGFITNFILSFNFIGVKETVGLRNRLCRQQSVAAFALHNDLVSFV